MGTDAKANKVTDRSSLHRYRTEIPNIVLEMDLSVYAMRLYLQIKKIAGDDGTCYYSTRELAAQCKMSAGAISKAKQELLDADLIRIERAGDWERDNITIVDLWPANFAHFAQETKESPCSPHEQAEAPPVHHMNTPVHTVNASVHHMNTIYIEKEEPLKEEPIKEGETPARIASPREPASKDVRFKSPHLDLRHFVNGYIPPGAGTNAVEVYYERFSINQDAARLNAIKEDDLSRLCPDLDKLRSVIVAYSRTTFQPGNVQLILDWYSGGIPDKHKPPGTNGTHKNGAVGEAEKDALRTAALLAQSSINTATKFKGYVDPAWKKTIEKAKAAGVI